MRPENRPVDLSLRDAHPRRRAFLGAASAVGLTIFAVLMYFGLRNDLFGGGG